MRIYPYLRNQLIFDTMKSHVNTSFPEFIRLVDFYNADRRDQIAYLLFYVTEVSQFRKNMTAKILTQRLNDQLQLNDPDFQKAEEKEIEEILAADSTYFRVSYYVDTRDRTPGEIPYELTAEGKGILYNRHKARFYKLKLCHDIAYNPLLLFCFMTGLIMAAALSLQAGGTVSSNMAWKDYTKVLKFRGIGNNERALYFLYFVTDILEWRSSMSPAVIAERLRELGYEDADKEDIITYFEHTELVKPVTEDEDRYAITDEGKEYIRTKARIYPVPPRRGEITFVWIFEHLSFYKFLTLLTALLGICGICYGVGYKIAQYRDFVETEKEYNRLRKNR